MLLLHCRCHSLAEFGVPVEPGFVPTNIPGCNIKASGGTKRRFQRLLDRSLLVELRRSGWKIATVVFAIGGDF